MLSRMFSGCLPSRRDEKVGVDTQQITFFMLKIHLLAVICRKQPVLPALLLAGNVLAWLLLQGRVFLDRDPKHFRLILNFLRDGQVCLPSCPLELQEILQEALFYQVR